MKKYLVIISCITMIAYSEEEKVNLTQVKESLQLTDSNNTENPLIEKPLINTTKTEQSMLYPSLLGTFFFGYFFAHFTQPKKATFKVPCTFESHKNNKKTNAFINLNIQRIVPKKAYAALLCSTASLAYTFGFNDSWTEKITFFKNKSSTLFSTAKNFLNVHTQSTNSIKNKDEK